MTAVTSAWLNEAYLSTLSKQGALGTLDVYFPKQIEFAPLPTRPVMGRTQLIPQKPSRHVFCCFGTEAYSFFLMVLILVSSHTLLNPNFELQGCQVLTFFASGSHWLASNTCNRSLSTV